MAHEPKLEVYKIYSNPFPNTEYPSFGNFFQNKFSTEDKIVKSSEGFKLLLQTLITSIDTNFVLNSANKKGLRIDESTGTKALEKSIKIASVKQIIHGTIKGGRYGQNRSIGSTKDPKKKYRKVGQTDIVMDTFYFLLYTPFKSNKGILMIQSYTDDQINDIFINWLQNNLSGSGYFNPKMETYCPTKLQEEFKNSSAVKELKFTKDILISGIETEDGISTEEFSINISIRAKDSGKKVSKIGSLLKTARQLQFGKKENPLTLEEFNKQIGILYNGSHQSSFELDGEISIKPTIYLKDRIILQDDGSPNWDSLHDYCLNLLEEIKVEVYPENNELS